MITTVFYYACMHAHKAVLFLNEADKKFVLIRNFKKYARSVDRNFAKIQLQFVLGEEDNACIVLHILSQKKERKKLHAKLIEIH